MGYKQPFKQIGKVEPKLRNQSKSGLRMNDASPLSYDGPGDKPKKISPENQWLKLSEEYQKAAKGSELKSAVTGQDVNLTASLETISKELPTFEERKEALATAHRNLSPSIQMDINKRLGNLSKLFENK